MAATPRFKRVRSRVPSNAAPKPCTRKPGTSAPTSISISAFTTSRKRPKVRTVSGRVKNTIKGRTNAFTRPSTSAARNALPKPFTWTPGTRFATRRRSAAVITRCATNWTMRCPPRCGESPGLPGAPLPGGAQPEMEDGSLGSHVDVGPLLQQATARDLRASRRPHADAKLAPRAAIQSLDHLRPVAARRQTQILPPLADAWIRRGNPREPLSGPETNVGRGGGPRENGALSPTAPGAPASRQPVPSPHCSAPHVGQAVASAARTAPQEAQRPSTGTNSSPHSGHADAVGAIAAPQAGQASRASPTRARAAPPAPSSTR